jgi:hypothetical protein
LARDVTALHDVEPFRDSVVGRGGKRTPGVGNDTGIDAERLEQIDVRAVEIVRVDVDQRVGMTDTGRLLREDPRLEMREVRRISSSRP